MYTEKILGIVNARYKNGGKRQSMLKKSTRNRQCKVQECLEIVNVRRKILGIVNVHRKNTRNRQSKCKNAGKRQSMLKKCSESSMQGTRMLGNDKVSSMQGARMPGNRQCTQKNTRDRQCTQKKYSESSIQV